MREKTPKVLGEKTLEFTKIHCFYQCPDCFQDFMELFLNIFASCSEGTKLVRNIFVLHPHLAVKWWGIGDRHFSGMKHSSSASVQPNFWTLDFSLTFKRFEDDVADDVGCNSIRDELYTNSMRCSLIVLQADEGHKTLTRNGSAFSASSWNKLLLWPNVFRSYMSLAFSVWYLIQVLLVTAHLVNIYSLKITEHISCPMLLCIVCIGSIQV